MPHSGYPKDLRNRITVGAEPAVIRRPQRDLETCPQPTLSSCLTPWLMQLYILTTASKSCAVRPVRLKAVLRWPGASQGCPPYVPMLHSSRTRFRRCFFDETVVTVQVLQDYANSAKGKSGAGQARYCPSIIRYHLALLTRYPAAVMPWSIEQGLSHKDVFRRNQITPVVVVSPPPIHLHIRSLASPTLRYHIPY
jgi:hypothetical protein